MVTKNFVRTVIAGLKAWLDNRFGRLEISELELLNILTEADVIQPVANKEGAIYTSKTGQVYIL